MDQATREAIRQDIVNSRDELEAARMVADFASDKIEEAEKFVARMEKYLRDAGALKDK